MFLIAPFQRKGDDKAAQRPGSIAFTASANGRRPGRILYVAATRAREQLHFFARPACKERDGELTLAEPVNSLLLPPGLRFEEEVRARFEA